MLEKDSNFRQALPIPDKDLEKLIHHTNRLLFLKHCVLPRGNDDTNFQALLQASNQNFTIIVARITSDDTFIRNMSVHLPPLPFPTNLKLSSLHLSSLSLFLSLKRQFPQSGRNLEPPHPKGEIAGLGRVYERALRRGKKCP